MEENRVLLHFNQSKQDNELSDNRKGYLLTALTSSLRAGFYIDSLKTGFSRTMLHERLANIPQLKQESSIIELLDFLKNEGERAAYSILLPHLTSTYKPKEIESVIRKRFWGIDLFIQRAHHINLFLEHIKKEKSLFIEKKDLKSGILAWDMGELITLSRIACELGYINEDTAWHYIEFAGKQCFHTFNNWEEIGKSYLIGQAMKTGEKEDLKEAIRTYIAAITSEESPWEDDYFFRSTT